MILEDAFMELMEKVWRESQEDIRVWEVCPKRLIHRAQTICFECNWMLASLSFVQYLLGDFRLA